jgi:hypothetical protein
MNTTFTSNTKTTTREWAIDSEHVVTVTTKTENEYFGRTGSAKTVYSCACGKSTSHAGAPVKARLDGHNEWMSNADRDALRLALGL